MCAFSFRVLALLCFSILSFGKNYENSSLTAKSPQTRSTELFVPHVFKRDSDKYDSTNLTNTIDSVIPTPKGEDQYSQAEQRNDEITKILTTALVIETTPEKKQLYRQQDIHELSGLQIETPLKYSKEESSTEPLSLVTENSSATSPSLRDTTPQVKRTVYVPPLLPVTNSINGIKSADQVFPIVSNNSSSNYSQMVLEQILTTNNLPTSIENFPPTLDSNENQIKISSHLINYSNSTLTSTFPSDGMPNTDAEQDLKDIKIPVASADSSEYATESYLESTNLVDQTRQNNDPENQITLKNRTDFKTNVKLPIVSSIQSSLASYNTVMGSTNFENVFNVFDSDVDNQTSIPHFSQTTSDHPTRRDSNNIITQVTREQDLNVAQKMLGDDPKTFSPPSKNNGSDRAQIINVTPTKKFELKTKSKIIPIPKMKSKTDVQSLTTSAYNVVKADAKKLPQKEKFTSTPPSDINKDYRDPSKTTHEPKTTIQDKIILKKYLPLIPLPTKTKDLKDATKCNGVTPPYKLINKSGVYEVRIYPVSTWLSANVITNNRILAELEASNKLQKYFDGENERDFQLNRSCPVLTQIKLKDSIDAREKISEYAVSFYLPTENNSEVPSPNDSEVLVDTVEERTVYVYPFKALVWEMTDSFLQLLAKKLSTTLRNQGEPFLSKYFYIASYSNSRTSIDSADYELWMYATRFRPHQTTLEKQPIADPPLIEVTLRTKARVCRGYECPTFEVLALHGAGIQKRRYFGGRFATFAPEFCDFSKAGIWRAFMPLHLYKHGVNSHFEVIGPTRPAGVVHVRERSSNINNVTCSHTFTVSLYLPKKLQAAPPTAGAAAPRIKITELDDVIVYVQAVGGFLLVPERIQKEVGLFRQRLNDQKLCFKPDEFYLVVYDYISRFHGRLNEIWVLADRCSNSL